MIRLVARARPAGQLLDALIEKTVGLADPIREALRPLRSRIQEAFVYGSVAKGSANPKSDIDLLILSDGLDYAEVFSALAPAEHHLGRKIDPTISTPAEWKRKAKLRDSFAARVRGGRRIMIFEPLPPSDAER